MSVLPAHAGVILYIHVYNVEMLSITRTCGGEPDLARVVDIEPKYYPHMRG